MTNKNTGRKILLVFPGPCTHMPEMPLQLLYLASMLRENGYICQILDMRLQDYRNCDLKDILCVGITAMSGSMIKYGLKFARFVRLYNPDIPIVWGGVHPSMLPEQTIKNEYVDIIVRGEGELTFLELVQAIDKNNPFTDIKGITFNDGGKIINNPNRDFIDMNMIPIELPYDLIEINKYLFIFPIHTSRGCPHKCSFCYNLSYNRGSWRHKTAERVLDEIEYAVRKINAKHISFGWEDNFFVSKSRVEKICKGIIERKLNIKWDSFCRFDYLSKFDDDFIKLLEKSGCNLLSFGGESGSQEILDTIIHKETKIEQIIEGTKKMSKSKIIQIISFMCGVPKESYDDLKETFDLIDKLAKINPNAEFNGILFYTPYPGTDLMKIVQDEYGFQPPKTLEGWQDYKIFRDFGCTWHRKKYVKKLVGISIMTRLPFYTDNPKIPEQFNCLGYKHVYQFFSFLARFRWKYRFFCFPIEWRLLEKVVEKVRGYY